MWPIRIHARILAWPPGARVQRASHVRLNDRQPIGYVVTYIPASLKVRFDLKELNESPMLTSAGAQGRGHRLRRPGHQRHAGRFAPGVAARHYGWRTAGAYPPGGVQQERAQPVERLLAWYRGDYYHHHVHLTRKAPLTRSPTAGICTMGYFTRYQWTVLFAAWLGWGFDVFDGLLFNYVAPNCVPTLLGLPIGSAEAKQATLFWTGLLTSILLLGWAVGGVIFGLVCDRIGRTRTLLITMLLYAVGTAACALCAEYLVAGRVSASSPRSASAGSGPRAPRWSPRLCRRRSAWRRARCCTRPRPWGCSSPPSSTCRWPATGSPTARKSSWRYVFLFGLLPAARGIRRAAVREGAGALAEPGGRARRSRISELFTPGHPAVYTVSGFLMAVTALLTWWSCNAFIPVVSERAGAHRGRGPGARHARPRWPWWSTGRRWPPAGSTWAA